METGFLSWIMTILGSAMAAAWVRSNWLEGRAIAAQVAGQGNTPSGSQTIIYFLLACLDDLPPTLLLFFLFRGFMGSAWAWIVGLCMYGPITFMYLRATASSSDRPMWLRLIDKLLDDVADGWLGFGALAAIFGWLQILIPAITITI